MTTTRSLCSGLSLAMVTMIGLLPAAAQPTISQQPQSTNVAPGLPVRFQVVAGGSSLTYQWVLNDSPLAGATTSALLIPNVQTSHAGAYSVVVTNNSGTTNSAFAQLVVGPLAVWGSANSGPNRIPLDLTNAIAAAAGASHVLAVRGDGTVAAWGSSGSHTNPPVDLLDGVAVAAGQAHSVSVRRDGSVVAFGSNTYAQTNVPPTLTNASALAAGNNHTLALTSDGRVVAWGRNTSSQTNAPANLVDAVGVAAGADDSIAVRADGSARWWGSVSATKASFLTGLSNAIALASGYDHCLALTPEGRVLAGGDSGSVELNVPPSLTNAVAVAAGYNVSYALTEDGALVSWGMSSGQPPPLPSKLTNLLSLSAGNSANSAAFGIALVGDGRPGITVQPGGQAAFAGNGTTLRVRATGQPSLAYQWFCDDAPLPDATNRDLVLPVVSTNDSGAYFVVVTNAFGAATSRVAVLSVKPRSPLLIWGARTDLFLNQPVDLPDVIAASACASHCLALNADGTVAGWGTNNFGQATVPVGLANVIAVATGTNHSAALLANGSVTAWGNNTYGQTNVPSSLTNAVALAAGGWHTLALRNDGTVVVWGVNSLGVTNVPAGLSNVVAIAGGGSFSLALKEDGRVVGWGANSAGQTNIPPSLTNALAIAGGGAHALALRADGSVVAWGSNSAGQTNVPPGLTNAVAIGAGALQSLAVRADGSVVGWGAANAATAVPASATNVIAVTGSVSNSLALRGTGMPFITVQPWDRRGRSLQPLEFVVPVVGQPPLSFQWYFNGAPVPGATSTALGLACPQAWDAGSYWLVAENAHGAVTSRVFSVAIQPELSVAAWGINGEGQTDLPPGLPRIRKLAGGDGHTLALGEDDRAYAWGRSIEGQCAVPSTATNLVDIAAGGNFSLVVRREGYVYGWGNNGSEPYNLTRSIPPGTFPAKAVAAGEWGHALALHTDGTVWPWGWTSQMNSLSPSWPAGLNDAVAVAAGLDHCVALRGNGTVVCWSPSCPPVVTNTPAGLSNVVAIAAGDTHTLALRADGTVVAWGYLVSGNTNVPPDLTNAVAIAARGNQSLALTRDGRVVRWGGTLADPEDYSPRDVPAGLSNVVAIGAGATHGLAIVGDSPPCITQPPRGRTVPAGWPVSFTVTASGQRPLAVQWQFNGTNLSGATNTWLTLSNAGPGDIGEYRVVVTNLLGTTTSRVARLTLGPLLAWGGNRLEQCWVPAGVTNPVALGASGIKSIAVMPDGRVRVWGGVGLEEVPAITAINDARLIGGGAWFNGSGLVVRSNGSVAGWGLPEPPASVSNVISASVAGSSRAAVVARGDGTVVVWGQADAVLSNIPAFVTNVVAVAASDSSRVEVLRADGSVASWGNQWANGVLPGLSNAVAVGCGLSKSYALCSDGALASWDRNGIPTPVAGISNAVALAVGALHALVLKSDGAVVGLGSNQEGQIGLVSALSNVVEIAAGGSHSLARFGDGSPSFTMQPFNRSIRAGESLTLTAFAVGAPTLSYLWQYNGSVLPDATNATLVLMGTGLVQVGDYRCVVTNALGRATSAVARVSALLDPPRFNLETAPPAYEEGGFRFQIENLTGAGPLVLYASTNLEYWEAILTNPPWSGPCLLVDPGATNFTRRYYRAAEWR